MIHAFSRLTGVPVHVLRGREKRGGIADYRHVYWYLLLQSGLPVTHVALMHRVTHASIVFARKKIAFRLQNNDKQITAIYNQTKHLTK
jgi:hypothetical protein